MKAEAPKQARTRCAGRPRTGSRRPRWPFVAEGGQNLVETCIVLPLLFLLLVGIADLGRAFYTYITITNVAREGARYASRWPLEEAKIVQVAMDEADGIIVPRDALTVTIVPEPTARYDGTPIEVTAETDFRLLLSALWGPDTIRMARTTTMVSFGWGLN